MRDFKKFYESQEILSEDGQAAFDKLTGKIGSGLRWTFSKLSKAISKPIKDLFTPAMNSLKGKFDAVLSLAEKYYPYDKDIYEQIKRDQNKTKMLDNYLSLYNDESFSMPGGIKYSVGIDIIYRVYAKVAISVKVKNESDTTKTSIRSLEQGARYANLRIPQLKTIKDVDNYFATNQTDQNSMLGKWIKSSTVFSSWKNKYDNTDEENSTATIVDQFLSSNSSNIDLDNADKKMEELKQNGEEVNMQNIDKSFGKDFKNKIQVVQKNILDGRTIIGDIQNDIEFNEAEFERVLTVLQRLLNTPGSDQTFTDIYAVTKYIQAKQNNTIAMDILFQQTYFYKLFNKVSTPEAVAAYKSIQENKDKKQYIFMQTYLKLLTNLIPNEKMTKELADDINKLMELLYKNMQTEL